ncbi:hypothetical protein FPANT_2225 [Fusarium pseudoanthophilum]|uniref:Uncharacterized protein n=1 Tax=Fusarium pseudoanthophilum TaxID=48495 RepID=A0A8H5UV98_9HYPO|nr:hypothetical protein FPANT_2225 [Fusarium pseudoanthophilum]
MEIARGPNAKIIDLIPIEIFSHIISYFCSHCSGDIGDDNNAADVKVLVALTQTNRHFRSIAMPILFHSIGPRISSTYFFRVLDSQPDLARTVKHLSLPLSAPKCSSIMSDSALFTRFTDRLSLNPEWAETMQSSAVDGEMCLAMALCSDIERLKIQIAYHQVNEHTRHLELLDSLLENRQDEEIFPKLRYLDIDKSQYYKFSLCDPEPILLLRGAPHLQTLILRGPGDLAAQQSNDSTIQEFCAGLANIKELQILNVGPFITGDGQTRALEQILGAAQNLETFKFVGVGYDGMNDSVSLVPATQLLEFLHPQTKKTLQHLSLNFDRVRDGRSSQLQPITPQQIKQFTSLHTLELDPSCYCTSRLRDGVEIQQFMSSNLTSQLQGSAPDIASIYEQETYLVDFLPPTVETLTIFLDLMALYGLAYDTTLLAQQVVSGKYPNLKRVQVDAPIRRVMPAGNSWDYDFEEMEQVNLSEMEARGEAFREAFVGSGVETRFETWFVEEGWGSYI